MEKEKCVHCGHTWIKRMDNPTACPKCNRRNYSAGGKNGRKGINGGKIKK